MRCSFDAHPLAVIHSAPNAYRLRRWPSVAGKPCSLSAAAPEARGRRVLACVISPFQFLEYVTGAGA